LLGIVVSPLPMPYREHELVEMGTQAAFRAHLTLRRFGDRHPAQEARAVQDQLPRLETVIAYGPPDTASGATEGVLDLGPTPATDADRAAVRQRRQEDPSDPNDPVTICWTSGTENTPKGVPRCHHDWLAVAWGTTDAPRVVTEDVLLNPFPMVNMAGISGMLLPWLRTGCVLVQHHPFHLPTLLTQIAQEHITYTVAPPALLWMLLHDEALLAATDLSSLTRIGSGSVPLPPAMVRGWQERFGIGVINFFGSNEGVGLLCSPADVADPDERARYFPRYGAPGVTWSTRVAEWVGVRLVDLVTGQDITEPGRPGELRISGPTVFAGYLHGAQRASPFDERGWLRSGDLFEIAGERGEYLRFLDRVTDVVIRGGANIAPAELEGLIGQHPAVSDVAVIGDPDPVLGERVAAVVTLHPGTELTLAELVGFLRGHRVASFKLPERLEVRDVLPRNPVGKILRRGLRPPAPAQ
ncbi:MAG: fatty acid--CoA ligase family protein, partial [Mycobacteriaceae bacterium]